MMKTQTTSTSLENKLIHEEHEEARRNLGVPSCPSWILIRRGVPRRMDNSLLRDETGQAAVVVALFFFFVFLAFAALGIDGSAIYLTRRDLQNVADASALSACRVIAEGGTTTEGLTAALNTIQTNMGSWAEYAGPNPPTSNTGAGVTLLKGVEVSDPVVRVALQRPAPTVLTQFVGRTQTIVTAQARCDSRAGGGLLPIAVQRYDGDSSPSYRDYLANKDASGSSYLDPNPPPMPYPQDSVTETIPSPPARYPPWFQVPVPIDPIYTARDGALSDSWTGPEVPLVGNLADQNNIASSMSGLVLLDIRNVGSGNALEYYNGVDGQGNTNREVSRWHICRGYLGPYPEIGSQVAILDGVGANFGPMEMRRCYRVGDEVAVIIYDGFVWSTPDFEVTLTPTSDPDGIISGYPDSAATAVTYDVKIERAGPASAQWLTSLNFGLAFDFSEATLPPGTHVLLNGTTELMPNLTYSVTNIVESTGWSGTLTVYSESAGPSPITQTVQYLSGLNLIADSSSGLSRGVSTNYGFGPIAADYTVRTENGRVVARQEGSATVKLLTYGTGSVFPGGSGCNASYSAKLLLGGTQTELAWSAYFSSSPTENVRIKNTLVTDNFNMNVLATTPSTGSFTLRLTVAASACGPAHSVDIPLQILPPAAIATPDKYVNIQGYAVFRISYMDSNDVLGYAVSPLYDSFAKIRFGLSARLVPWN